MTHTIEETLVNMPPLRSSKWLNAARAPFAQSIKLTSITLLKVEEGIDPNSPNADTEALLI